MTEACKQCHWSPVCFETESFDLILCFTLNYRAYVHQIVAPFQAIKQLVWYNYIKCSIITLHINYFFQSITLTYNLFLKQHPALIINQTTVKEILILLQQTASCEVEQLTSLLEYSHEEHTKPVK